MKKLSFLLAATLLLSACDFSFSTAPSLPTPQPISTPLSTLTFPPSPTATTSPATSVPTAVPTSSPTSADLNTFQVALVDPIGDTAFGTFGCGDKIVMVSRPKKSRLTKVSLTTTLVELLSIKDREYQEGDKTLMNALAESQATVNSVTILNGAATIRLEGYFTFAGTCDVPRVKEQIIQTITNFPEVKSYTILLNGSAKEWECVGDQSGNCM